MIIKSLILYWHVFFFFSHINSFWFPGTEQGSFTPSATAQKSHREKSQHWGILFALLFSFLLDRPSVFITRWLWQPLWTEREEPRRQGEFSGWSMGYRHLHPPAIIRDTSRWVTRVFPGAALLTANPTSSSHCPSASLHRVVGPCAFSCSPPHIYQPWNIPSHRQGLTWSHGTTWSDEEVTLYLQQHRGDSSAQVWSLLPIPSHAASPACSAFLDSSGTCNNSCTAISVCVFCCCTYCSNAEMAFSCTYLKNIPKSRAEGSPTPGSSHEGIPAYNNPFQINPYPLFSHSIITHLELFRLFRSE